VSFQRFDALVQPFGDVRSVPDRFASPAAAVPGGGLIMATITSNPLNAPGLVRLDANGNELFRIARESSHNNRGFDPTLGMAGELAVVNNQSGLDAYDLAGNLRWSLTLPFPFERQWPYFDSSSADAQGNFAVRPNFSSLSADAQGNLTVVDIDATASWEDDGTAYTPAWAQQIAADGTPGQLWRLHANPFVGATTQPMSGRVLVLGPEQLYPSAGSGTLTALSSDAQTCSRYRYEGIHFARYLAAAANDDVYFLSGETVGRFVHIP
jgi:hypothetical protein